MAEKKKLEKFGLQTEQSKNITVFPNGDKNHAGYKMVIHSSKFKNLDQVNFPLCLINNFK